MNIIGAFDGTEYRFLSNFYRAGIIIDEKYYPTSEHFYQSMKSTDVKVQESIRELESPGDAKRAGRKITIRSDWEDVKYEVMIKALRAKFTQHDDLRSKLIETGNSILIESNCWHDNDWGVCVCNMARADSANQKCTGKGQNLLGKALMQIREEMKINENKEIYVN